MEKLTVEKQSALKWVVRSTKVRTKYFNDEAWISIGADGITGESKDAPGTVAPSQELRDYAASQLIVFKAAQPAEIKKLTEATQSKVCSSKPHYRRSSCLNCGMTASILLGRGYCTDCHGEC
jgi:hypothetical protein